MHFILLLTGIFTVGLTNAHTWNWNTYEHDDLCPPAVVSLATGIHLNIVGQVNGMWALR